MGLDGALMEGAHEPVRCGMPMLFHAFVLLAISKMTKRERSDLRVEAREQKLVGWIEALEEFEKR